MAVREVCEQLSCVQVLALLCISFTCHARCWVNITLTVAVCLSACAHTEPCRTWPLSATHTAQPTALCSSSTAAAPLQPAAAVAVVEVERCHQLHSRLAGMPVCPMVVQVCCCCELGREPLRADLHHTFITVVCLSPYVLLHTVLRSTLQCFCAMCCDVFAVCSFPQTHISTTGEPASRPQEPPGGGLGAGLSPDDMAAAAKVLRDATERSVLPKLEERIARLNLSITGAKDVCVYEWYGQCWLFVFLWRLCRLCSSEHPR